MRDDKRLEDIRIFQKAMAIGEEVWGIVSTWDYFHRDTIGKEWVTSTDSIAANIAEGFGRFHYKDKKLFYYYSRGSVMESKTWLVKAHSRPLILFERFAFLFDELNHENAMPNHFIKSVG